MISILATLLLMFQFGGSAGMGGKAGSGGVGSSFGCNSVAAVAGAIDCWPITEGTGATINTLTGTGNNITIGTPANFAWTTASGFPGNVGNWSGSYANAVASSSTLENFSSTQAFSVSAWVNFSGGGSTYAFASNINTSVSHNPGWFVGALFNTASEHFATILQDNAGGSMVVHVASTASCSSACNVLYTNDGTGTAGGARIYVNCVSQTLVTDSNTLGTGMQSGIPLAFSQLNSSTALPATSVTMGSVAVWNFALNSTQACAVTAAGPN